MQIKTRIDKIGLTMLPWLAMVFSIYLLAAVQNWNGYTIIDQDTYFHYSRFYDAAMQIKHGTYNLFQTNYAFNHSGRVTSAVYGPLFTYLMGGILLVLGTWYRFQIFTYYALGLLAGTGMYFLLRKLRINRVFSTFFAIFYLNIGPIQSWFDHTNMTAWGGAIAPFVLLEGINMLQDRDRPVRWVRLMFWMSVMAQIHVLSVLILALALVPFVVIGFARAQSKRGMIISLLLAVLATTLLSANVWGSLCLLYLNNHLVPTTQYLLSSKTFELSTIGTIRRRVLPVMRYLFLLMLLRLIFNLRFKARWLTNFLTIYALGMLFCVSSKFPWDYLQAKLPIIGSYFQFPYRLLIVGYPLMLASLALTLTELAKRPEKLAFGTWAAFLILLLGVNVASNYSRLVLHTSSQYEKVKNSSKYYQKTATRGNYYLKAKNPAKLMASMRTKGQLGEMFKEISKINPDYMPNYRTTLTSTQAVSVYAQEIIKPATSGKFHYQVLANGALKVVWTGKKAAKVAVPVVCYQQSKVTVNGQVVSPKLSSLGVPQVQQKVGKNYLILQFIVPKWYLALLISSLLGWLGLGAGCLVKSKKHLTKLFQHVLQ
ncbi:hypothetical protein [Lactobacillus corticis]|uniref:Cell division protein n=1 Tax=Lactobacillus corticis TaxID=2201249 RepID=A0A916QK17_9LACO|nr:hypothetical protein [Lactobacillus corticis]GFZ27168.1 hypothetical protein LCB40_10480 [Lactobacillus corticis]